MDLPIELPDSSLDDALLTRIHDDVIASQSFGHNSNAAAKVPAKVRLSGSEKMDHIFDAVRNIEMIAGLLETTKCFITSVDGSKLKPAVDSLSLAVSELKKQTSSISKCADNTKEKKHAQQANTKLNKKQRQIENQNKFVLGRTMKDNPRDALLLELKSLRESLGTKKRSALSTLPNDSNHALLPRKIAKSDDDTSQIRIPRPKDGKLYTPQETVDVYHRIFEDIENKNLGTMAKSSYMKKVKLLMIEKRAININCHLTGKPKHTVKEPFC
jgi:FtsZ-binding cell division protein ZapB